MKGTHQKPHRNLVAWEKAIELVMEIYRITEKFPGSELYGLSAQLRRAAVSVPSNIAEGAADRTKSQFYNFLSNSIGSLNEIDTQIELAFRLHYISEHEYHHISRLVDECIAITYGLRKSIANKK